METCKPDEEELSQIPTNNAVNAKEAVSLTSAVPVRDHATRFVVQARTKVMVPL